MAAFLRVELHEERAVRWMQVPHARNGSRLQELQQSPDVFIGFVGDFAFRTLAAGTLRVWMIEVNQQRVIARWLESRCGSGRCLHIARVYNACAERELSAAAEAGLKPGTTFGKARATFVFSIGVWAIVDGPRQ